MGASSPIAGSSKASDEAVATMLPKRRFAIRALRVDPASHPAVVDAAFAARPAAQPGRNEHHVPPNRSGIKIPVPATVSCFLLCAASNCHSLGMRALEACRGTQEYAIHGLVESPPHISLAIYEGPDTEQPRIVAEHVHGNQSEINVVLTGFAILIRSEALAICDEPVAIDRAVAPRQRAGKSPTAIRRGKYGIRAIASMPFDESIAYPESRIALPAMAEDAREGLKAFGEKRKPSWPGK